MKLTSFHGARLADPKQVFNAGLDGNKWRAVDFREAVKLDKPALKTLLRDAVPTTRRTRSPKSRGSRA